ncbi:hypothetical protein [Nitrolancea hollandica]|uniref:Uncharacterized protein n=1 Tax=Nitrolancea hollandica Lb TaxID=1129897 RepID=I4EFN9_9BACT|nr:hypothetical protein [Nitrolancea hollandica]CCF83501.1 conserved hypothetical protein [Nitrolancea hollandica Lb]
MNEPVPNRQSPSFLQLCRQHRQALTMLFQPTPWNWVLSPDGVANVGGTPRALGESEVVIPRLDQIMDRLRELAEVVVIDCLPGDAACLAFDEDGRTLVNVVANGPEEAALQALLLLARQSADPPIKR